MRELAATLENSELAARIRYHDAPEDDYAAARVDAYAHARKLALQRAAELDAAAGET